MIICIASMSLAQGATAPKDVFSAAERALSKRGVISVDVTRDIVADGKTLRFSEELGIKAPNVVFYRSKANTSGATDRSVLIIGTELTMVDHRANEFIKRRFTGSGTPISRLATVVGTIDSVDTLAIDVEALTKFFVSYQQFPQLNSVVTGSTISVHAGPKVTMNFDRASHLLRELCIENTQGKLHAQFRYRDTVTAPSLPVSASARQVQVFNDHPLEAKFTTPLAKSVANACAGAFRTLLSGFVEISVDATVTELIFSDRRFRERRANLTWMYDGSQLTVLNSKTNTAYRGASTRVRIPGVVAALGGQVDPFTMRLLRREFPLADLFAKSRVVSSSGTIESKGSAFDILRSDAMGSRVSMLVRRDNHLPESTTADVLGPDGKGVYSSLRQFKYKSLNAIKSDSETKLDIPASVRVLPLPVVKN